ncbi:Response regulator receiver modulated FAD-dependent pyridine nucleotide-disulfide oxidoreductase [Candidatus Sulfotelmatomonas gaucii]|uniref:Response regulator receiver modulated FAD-dependent pyridine nucleotide-disulfide oxidoreductase n=1 Tax=Candidatus Sulfuritelmatomonas gaucii TaxID=2043161 RepID=A0A2N9L3T1_9BACT|nr:Response regulator receiver modulated FAD-dependent pyridine nucleotide-disulfide oxidoreductase [Candidatus Sulfotelmatomonas gaucii]
MNKPVLLIVDDDPQVLAAVRRDLRSRYRENYTVMSAASGQEALNAIRELKSRGDSLAMLICDQRMPGMMGSEVLAKSRAIYPLARRVLLTAYSDIDAAVKAINEAHLDHYLSKPWDPPEERLFPAIDDLLDAWQAEYLPEAKGLRLVGYQWSPQSHAIKDFLASNLIPYRWLDVTRDADARALLDAAGVTLEELPALFFDDGSPVMRNPDARQVAERLGKPLTAAFDVYDLAIVGAGPAGLAAAVYGASEGLRTLLLDRHAPGGQAGSSSRIENYLGFPAGVSGSELARRAITQAQRLGAEFLAPLEVTGVAFDGGYKRLVLSDGRQVVTRAMLASTGMFYREHSAPGIAEHTGAGVYYGAATTEASAFRDRRVIVVGGGNSAGQGAIYLARYASQVEIVIRRDSLRETMSQYLIEQIEKTPNIQLRPQTEVERVEGEGHVERVVLKSLADGSTSPEQADALFIFIGTRPRSDWLPNEVLRDAKGFVLTGRDVMAAEDYARIWKEQREPLVLETSVPGVFAAGDLRAGAMNRVASAVGEGSMVVRLAHEYLALT